MAGKEDMLDLLGNMFCLKKQVLFLAVKHLASR